MRTGSSILLLLLVISIGSCTRSNLEKYAPAIDSSRVAIEKIQEKYMVPGIAACVSIDGEIVWCEGFGKADMELNIPMDPYSTLCRIGSVSKPFTAEALAILREEGKLHYDDPIQKYVPYFPEKKFPVTIRQVAGHIAGIRHYKDESEMYNTKHFETVKSGLTMFMNDTLLFEPGTDYKYSSFGWNLLSAVVEGASGEEFLTFMQNRVFSPLDMKAQPDFTGVEIPGRTQFYDRKDNRPVLAPTVDNSYKWAGGGFLATCEDLIKFGNAHLSPVLISENSLDELISPVSLSDTVSTEYGIGWQNKINDYGVAWYGHSGGSVGGITMMAVYPGSKTVISLVSNSSNVGYEGVFHHMERWFNKGQ